MKYTKSSFLKTVSAITLTTVLMVPGVPEATTIHLPADPVAPTELAECQALEARYEALIKQIQAQRNEIFEYWKSGRLAPHDYLVRDNELGSAEMKLMDARNAAYSRCADKVRAYKQQQSAERQAQAQQQQAIAQHRPNVNHSYRIIESSRA